VGTLKKSVVVAHFRNLLSQIQTENNSEDFDLIDLLVSIIESDLHPVDVFNSKAITRIREITNVDITSLSIQGIEKGNIVSAQLVEPIQSSCVSCKYFSCAENLSVHYKYANPVNISTCSHPDSPYGLYCSAGSVHVTCPSYVADAGEYAKFTVKDQTAVYTVDFHRTSMGSIKFFIKDLNNNILNELSYYADFYSKIEKDSFDFELKNIIEEIHSNTTATNENVISSFVEQKSQENASKVSYLSYLTNA
jgi:hypothetical protein